MNIEVPIAGATWGELRALVNLAGHKSPNDPVELGYDDYEPNALILIDVPPAVLDAAITPERR